MNEKEVDVHNIEPDLIDLYRQKYDLKDSLAIIDKSIAEYQSEKINALRQVEGLKKYTGESRDFKISYNPSREYFSWVARADPVVLTQVLSDIISNEYGAQAKDRFNKLIGVLVKSLLERKMGYERYEVRRHRSPKKHLHETTLEVNIVTEDET